MREIACDIRGNTNLVGIYTQAGASNNDYPADTHSAARPVVLLLSSGLLSNTGPYRLYVRLARHLASIGFDSFRFDLSGIGDSPRSTNSLPRAEQQIRDIAVAMDYLEGKFESSTYVAMGICTGADNAHRAMLADHRVIGAVGVDGYYYKTPRYYLNYLFKQLPMRLLKRERWQKKLIELSSAARDRLSDRKAINNQPDTVPYRWDVPDREKTAADYHAFIGRDVNKLCIFTASWPYNYLQQHSDAFPDVSFGDNVQVRYFENAAHVFPLAQERDLLTTTISDWLLERFGSTDD